MKTKLSVDLEESLVTRLEAWKLGQRARGVPNAEVSYRRVISDALTAFLDAAEEASEAPQPAPQTEEETRVVTAVLRLLRGKSDIHASFRSVLMSALAPYLETRGRVPEPKITKEEPVSIGKRRASR